MQSLYARISTGYGAGQKFALLGGMGARILLTDNRENITKAFSYVPSHLHHMIFELLKNSMRAVVERYGVDADTYPPIKMVFAEGKEDITIKISDEGGGIPRSGMV
jgi:DNA gyrase/topoisomerase IV subunit B